jgi:hypothetical protein
MQLSKYEFSSNFLIVYVKLFILKLLRVAEYSVRFQSKMEWILKWTRVIDRSVRMTSSNFPRWKKGGQKNDLLKSCQTGQRAKFWLIGPDDPFYPFYSYSSDLKQRRICECRITAYNFQSKEIVVLLKVVISLQRVRLDHRSINYGHFFATIFFTIRLKNGS